MNRGKKRFPHFAGRAAAALFFAAAAVIFLSACRDYAMDVERLDREITVDGDASDWLGLMRYMDNENMSIGAARSETHFYLCLTSGNMFRVMQAMGRGMTVWFDPAGGKEKVLGIRYPLGRSLEEGKMEEGEVRKIPAGRPEPGRFPQGFSGERFFEEMFSRMTAELEILSDGGEQSRRIPIGELSGIELRIGRDMGRLVYEAAIPLNSLEIGSFQWDITSCRTLGVGLEVPKGKAFPGRRPGGGMGGLPPGGGMGRPGGGMGGFPGGMPGGGFPKMPNGLKVWIKINMVPTS